MISGTARSALAAQVDGAADADVVRRGNQLGDDAEQHRHVPLRHRAKPDSRISGWLASTVFDTASAALFDVAEKIAPIDKRGPAGRPSRSG